MPAAQELALRDIHLPDPVSWWPPAPGWWMILGLIAFVICAFFIIRYLIARKELKKTALAELEKLKNQYTKDGDLQQLVISVSMLMRRVCISFHPRIDVASLTGKQWLKYLDNTSDGSGFENGCGHVLATAPYLKKHKVIEVEAKLLIELCRSWINYQKNSIRKAPKVTLA